MLIVLDNFEQVLDAAPLIARLFTEMPEATFLVTSRARLRLRGEQRLRRRSPSRCPTLAAAAGGDRAVSSAAVRLFRDRARAAQPPVRPHGREHRRGGADLRRPRGRASRDRTGGRPHPACSRPRMLLERLDQRLPLLVGSARDLPDRQRTMRGDHRVERRACWMPRPAICSCASASSPETSVWRRSRRSPPAHRGRADTLSLLADAGRQQPRPLAGGRIDRLCSGCSLPCASSRWRAWIRDPRRGRRARGSTPTTTRGSLSRDRSAAARAGPSWRRSNGWSAERDNLRAAGPPPPRERSTSRRSARGGLGPVPVLVDPRADARSARVDGAILATGIDVSDRTRAIALGFSSWVSLWQERGGARRRDRSKRASGSSGTVGDSAARRACSARSRSRISATIPPDVR